MLALHRALARARNRARNRNRRARRSHADPTNRRSNHPRIGAASEHEHEHEHEDYAELCCGFDSRLAILQVTSSAAH